MEKKRDTRMQKVFGMKYAQTKNYCRAAFFFSGLAALIINSTLLIQ